MMKRILVPIDFSTPSLAALTQAVRYTQAVHGELLLLHVVEGEPLQWYTVNGQPEAPSARLDPMTQLVLPQRPQQRVVRFRTLGCYPLTGAVESEASTLPDIIREMLLATTSERQGRAIDHDQSASMEKKKQEGYF